MNNVKDASFELKVSLNIENVGFTKYHEAQIISYIQEGKYNFRTI